MNNITNEANTIDTGTEKIGMQVNVANRKTTQYPKNSRVCILLIKVLKKNLLRKRKGKLTLSKVIYAYLLNASIPCNNNNELPSSSVQLISASHTNLNRNCKVLYPFRYTLIIFDEHFFESS